MLKPLFIMSVLIWLVLTGVVIVVLVVSQTRTKSGPIVAYTDGGQNTTHAIFLADLQHRLHIDLIPNLSFNNTPQWSPDGQTLVFSCTQEGRRRLCRYDIGGRVTYLPIDHDAIQPQWSPDGRLIQYVHEPPGGLAEIRLYDMQTRTDTRFVVLEGGYTASAWSPDGQHIAYAERIDLAADWRIQIRQVTDAAQIGRGLVDDFQWVLRLAWSPDGRTLACLCRGDFDGMGHIVLIDTDTGEHRRIHRVLGGSRPVISWLPDGEHLLMYDVFSTGQYELLRIADRHLMTLADLGTAVTPSLRPGTMPAVVE